MKRLIAIGCLLATGMWFVPQDWTVAAEAGIFRNRGRRQCVACCPPQTTATEDEPAAPAPPSEPAAPAPKPAPKVTPLPNTTKPAAPAPKPAPAAPKTAEPKSVAPTPPAPKAVEPKTPPAAPKAPAPKAAEVKPVAPKPPAPKAVEPKTPAAPKAAAPKPDAPKSDADKPDATKADAKKQTNVSAPRKIAAQTAAASEKKPALFGPSDWNQWAGSSARNNTPEGKNVPTEWNPGEFDSKTGEWQKDTAENIKWVATLGSQSYGNPVVANGKIYVGTNNGNGWLKRYPSSVDLGCLLCFNEEDGAFLWQHSSEKLPTGRVHDWPLQGICCSPLIEGDKLWFVTSRGEVACLDVEGFHDGENDGPFTAETHPVAEEADVIWIYDMMEKLGTSQHNMCSCSVTTAGDLLFVCTSNGVDESHINLPSPNAPSFLAMNKHTGEVLWTDDSPGQNILHGQWSSPCYAVFDGVPQLIFAGGDAYLYSFAPEGDGNGKSKLLWKFDANPKESKYILGGRGTRNEIIATPVAYDGKVYLAVGQDPEHGEGIGHLWCIDPTKRGDVSPELAFKLPDLKNPIPHRRLQAVIAEDGEVAKPNPNSAVVWHYSEVDRDGNGKMDFEETMHRTIGTVAIKNDLLIVPDFSGLVHCVDARTGQPYWTHDLFAATWGSPLIVEDKVYVGDEEGKLTIFRLSKELEIINEIDMGNSIYSTPVVANGILYLANKTHLFAIQDPNAGSE